MVSFTAHNPPLWQPAKQQQVKLIHRSEFSRLVILPPSLILPPSHSTYCILNYLNKIFQTRLGASGKTTVKFKLRKTGRLIVLYNLHYSAWIIFLFHPADTSLTGEISIDTVLDPCQISWESISKQLFKLTRFSYNVFKKSVGSVSL
jgi:hypothetical protein